MTRLFNAALTAGCIAIVMFASSCKKDLQPLAPADMVSAPNAAGEIKKCEISRIISYDPSFVDPLIITFEYNKRGDPVSITPSFQGLNTQPLLFRYDKRGRLSDFIVMDNYGYFELWYKYVYDKHNTIIRDTLYVYGRYGEEPTLPVYTKYGTYVYDDQGRIIRINRTLGGPIIDNNDIVYDADGNLVRFGLTAYDNQVNLLRTNEILQFVLRDYSVNNPVTASSYNNSGLPLVVNSPPPPYWFFYQWRLNNSAIEYNCKGNSN